VDETGFEPVLPILQAGALPIGAIHPERGFSKILLIVMIKKYAIYTSY
jgi:hypothetical protein